MLQSQSARYLTMSFSCDTYNSGGTGYQMCIPGYKCSGFGNDGCKVLTCQTDSDCPQQRNLRENVFAAPTCHKGRCYRLFGKETEAYKGLVGEFTSYNSPDLKKYSGPGYSTRLKNVGISFKKHPDIYEQVEKYEFCTTEPRVDGALLTCRTQFDGIDRKGTTCTANDNYSDCPNW